MFIARIQQNEVTSILNNMLGNNKSTPYIRVELKLKQELWMLVLHPLCGKALLYCSNHVYFKKKKNCFASFFLGVFLCNFIFLSQEILLKSL